MRNTLDNIKIAAGIQHSMMENADGLYWVAYEIEDVGGGEARAFPVISRIDQASTSIGDPLPLGRDGNKQLYYIDPSFPVLSLSPTEHVYFGADVKGKNIWFCKLKL